MVACPKCVVNNTLDSAFCKKCGVVLPVAVIEEEQEKLKEIVTKGMESYQGGNLEEALAISEHAILTNPSYGEAYALKGLIHERKGEYAEALDSYETVVALNPDSTIDKIKLNQLRNAFAQRQAGEPKTDRKGALLLALGATGFAAACGVIIYGVILNSKETKDVSNTNLPAQSRTVSNTNTTNPGVNTASNQFVRDPNKPNETGDPRDVKALGNTDGNGVTDSRPQTNNRPRFDRTNGNAYDNGDITIMNPFPKGPIDRTLPSTDGTPKTEPHKSNDGGDPPVKPNQGGDSSGNGSTITASKDPDADKGIYQISSSATGPGNGTSRNTNDSSGSAGKNYQRQGQTLARSGKTSQARDAFQKAIDAYEKEISSGKGDKEAAQAGLNSSRQALKNLKD